MDSDHSLEAPSRAEYFVNPETGITGAFAAPINRPVTPLGALQSSERSFRAIVENSSDGILLVDVRGRVRYASVSAGKLYHCKPDTLVGEYCKPLVHPEDYEVLLEAVRTLLRQPFGKATIEIRIQTADGISIWVESRITNLLDEPGVQGILVSLRDITARRRATLERDRLFSLTRDMFVITDTGGSFRRVSPALAHTLGYTTEELLRKTAQELIHPDDLRRTVEEVGTVRSGNMAASVINRFVCKDGSTRWFSWNATRVPEEPIIYVVARDITSFKLAQIALEASEKRYRSLTEHSAVGIWHVKPDGQTIYANPAMCSMLEIDSMEELQQRNWFAFFPEQSLEVIRKEHKRREAHIASSYEVEVVGARGGRRDVIISGAPLTGSQDEVESLIGTFTEVTALKRTETALREAEEKYRAIFENAAEGIFQTTPGGAWLSVNPAFCRIFGYDSPDELLSLNASCLDFYVDPSRRRAFQKQVEAAGSVTGFESQIRRKDGALAWISENARVVRNETGAVLYYEGTLEDISQRKRAEMRLFYDAFHDKLTGLNNRAFFMDRLKSRIEGAVLSDGPSFAVLFLDFDRFKVINDSLGHAAGDELLVDVAHRLERCLRPFDIIARIGGDEFAILLPTIKDRKDPEVVAERIQQELAAPFDLGRHRFFTSASIGITLGDRTYISPEAMLRDADMAMYHAKGLGGAGYQIFNQGMYDRAMAHLEMETALRWAIERKELEVHYQPIISLETGALSGMEALLRWRHPEQGWIAPEKFIPLAEETGAIVSINRWVLRESCRQVKEWNDRLQPANRLTLSVNISGRQLSQPDLLHQVEQALQETGFPSDLLKLEFPESAIVENPDSAAAVILAFRKMGIRDAIDNFGAVYSPLSYLQRVPLTTVKIDRSFLRQLEANSANAEILRVIIGLARQLNVDVVAVGVESQSQQELLRSMGCAYSQGFLFSRPLTAAYAERLISKMQESESPWSNQDPCED